MVQPMGLGTLDENHPIPLATHEGQNPNLGKFEETWDGWTIGVYDVSKGRGNYIPPTSRMQMGH